MIGVGLVGFITILASSSTASVNSAIDRSFVGDIVIDSGGGMMGGVDAVALTHLDTAARAPLRLARSYQVGGQRVTRIVPGPEHDLAWQERLTGMLLRARPEYTDPGGDWPGVVGEVPGAPVVLLSHGPTAADKQAVALRSG